MYYIFKVEKNGNLSKMYYKIFNSHLYFKSREPRPFNHLGVFCTIATCWMMKPASVETGTSYSLCFTLNKSLISFNPLLRPLTVREANGFLFLGFVLWCSKQCPWHLQTKPRLFFRVWFSVFKWSTFISNSEILSLAILKFSDAIWRRSLQAASTSSVDAGLVTALSVWKSSRWCVPENGVYRANVQQLQGKQ